MNIFVVFVQLSISRTMRLLCFHVIIYICSVRSVLRNGCLSVVTVLFVEQIWMWPLISIPTIYFIIDGIYILLFIIRIYRSTLSYSNPPY